MMVEAAVQGPVVVEETLKVQRDLLSLTHTALKIGRK